jgi:two-component system, OmpR family, response regulator
MESRILVLEKDPSIIELYKDLFSDEGYETVAEELATLCPERVEQLAPNLIILDHMLYDKPAGLEFLHRLKGNEGTANIPVVICTTAVQMIRSMEQGLKAMGVDALFKPFENEELLASVQYGLDKHSAHHLAATA